MSDIIQEKPEELPHQPQETSQDQPQEQPSEQTIDQEKVEEQPPPHIPFILQSLGWTIPSQETETPEKKADESSKASGPGWDISHMRYRSYDLEYVGEIFATYQAPPPPPPPPPLPPSTNPPNPLPSPSTNTNPNPKSKPKTIKTRPQIYQPPLLPELTALQVTTTFTKFLSQTTPWNRMTGFLQDKYTQGEMQIEDLREWKDMIRSIKRVGEMRSYAERELYQRRFVNMFLLWFVSVDVRYGFVVADEFAKMVGVPQVTLNIDGVQFALYEMRDMEVLEGEGEE